MVNFIQQHVTRTDRVSKGTNPCTTITIHETANRNKGAGAQAHADLQSRGNRAQGSWHESIDDTKAIQSFKPSQRTWHAGKAAGNNTSYSIELCVNPDSDWDKTLENAAERVRTLMAEFGIGIDKVVQHNHWSGKNCPTTLRQGNAWAEFKALVTNGAKPAPAPAPPAPSGKLLVDGDFGPVTKKALQARLGVRVDGDFGPLSKKALQKHLGVIQDGNVGPVTVKAMQKRLGVLQDGYWGPLTTKALQAALNNGKF